MFMNMSPKVITFPSNLYKIQEKLYKNSKILYNINKKVIKIPSEIHKFQKEVYKIPRKVIMFG